jgi:hypothetical protein
MKKYLAGTFVVLALYGCAGDAQVRSVTTLAIACDTYATALDFLTPMRREGKLTDSQVSRIDDANKALKPLCDVKAPKGEKFSRKAIDAVNSGIELLNTIRGI